MEPSKDQALKNFKIYKSFLETQTSGKIRRLCTDNGGEYINSPFKEFCAAKGIIMETTAPYSPAQNGIAEQLNRMIVEQARAMIYSKGLPKLLWPEAVKYACYIKNRSPT
jgi:transposase InsO family protein